ncbi:MAG TPA: HD domain-containing protein [Micromonosporaceae bacterium]|nr:HD domain-containing protein [Micromonosporaceae bacterium]
MEPGSHRTDPRPEHNARPESTPTMDRASAVDRFSGSPRSAHYAPATPPTASTPPHRTPQHGGPPNDPPARTLTPPPSFSALCGGAVPGDPTTNYSNVLQQRLRAMLSWQTGEDPVSSLVHTHRAVHSDGDAGLIRKAYGIAEQMHRGQMRKSGEPFITHPLAVAHILAELGMDTTTLVAALLHDTVEDTTYTLSALEQDFGEEVAILVDGVTKIDKVVFGADAEVETIRKMIIAAGRDVRVFVIKLADRLHNMRTLDARSRNSQVRIALATREVLIPLCERLGIQALKRELEDWALRAINPNGYAIIADYVKWRDGWDQYVEHLRLSVMAELGRFKISATVSPRPRHLYSIWRDTVNGGYPEPHDLPRVVVIIDGPETDCYAALGAIHTRWRPVPGRFKDFIASPKNNLYRSLHTSVLGPDDHAVEVLIRTELMHRSAEYGIIANYRYPQQAALLSTTTKGEQLDWLQRMLDWQAATADPSQFLASLRCDLAENQILVFTSAGQPVLLPADATPVDLAYTLGADLGHRCIGARVNGRMMPPSSVLTDGDRVEIMTHPGQRDEFDIDDKSPPPGPSAEWLHFVKTPQARLHIGRWFDEGPPAVTATNRIRLGRLAIGLALRRNGRGLASDLPLVRLLPQLGYPDLESLLVAVADHSISADRVVAELITSVDSPA